MRYAYLFIGLAFALSGCQQADGQGSVDWLTRSIAIVGAVIAVCGLALGIWNFFWDRRKFQIMRKERLEDKEERKREKEEEAKAKAESSRERVTTQLILGRTDGHLVYTTECRVRLYNPCTFTIPIKHVWLTFLDLEKTEKEGKRVFTTVFLYAELIAESPVAGKNVPSSRVRLGSSTGYDLKSREEVFFSYNLEPSIIKLISRITTEDDVYISIISTAGEIERVKSNEVLPGIKQMLNLPV